jgi:DNA-directed RNA polymerase specialized sigma24 family protein
MEFAGFYESARDDCLGVVLLNVGDQQLAEDLVAHAFTKAWMSWRKVRELQAPQGWVVRRALNAHVSWWRRRRREVALGSHDIAIPAEYVEAVQAGTRQAGRVRCNWRQERRVRRPVRISLTRISGCSKAAKCPPLPASP